MKKATVQIRTDFEKDSAYLEVEDIGAAIASITDDQGRKFVFSLGAIGGAEGYGLHFATSKAYHKPLTIVLSAPSQSELPSGVTTNDIKNLLSHIGSEIKINQLLTQ